MKSRKDTVGKCLKFLAFIAAILVVLVAEVGCFKQAGSQETESAPSLSSLSGIYGTGTNSSIFATTPCGTSSGVLYTYSSALTPETTQILSCVDGTASGNLPIQQGTASQTFTITVQNMWRNVLSTPSTQTFVYTPEFIAVYGSTAISTSVCRMYVVKNLNSGGSVTAAALDVPITVSGLGSGTLYADPGCTTAATTLTISSGLKYVAFYFFDATAESVTLGAVSGTGNTSQISVTTSVGSVAWVEKSPITFPPKMILEKSAFDVIRGSMIMYGGQNNAENAIYDTMWEYAAGNWTQLCAGCGPGQRQSHAFVYDSARDKIVLFGGGVAPGSWQNDTWEWDGITWTNVTASIGGTAPSPRGFMFSAYDSNRGRMVIFGGQDNSGTYLDEVWEYDGVNWYGPFVPGFNPGVRGDEGMSSAFDPIHNLYYIVGGDTGGASPYDDVWAWDGTTWTRKCNNCTGTPRSDAYVAFDASRDKLIVVQGVDEGVGEVSGTNEFDGGTFAMTAPNGDPPPGRDSGNFSFNAFTGTAVYFGGNTCGVNCDYQDTWEYGEP